MSSFIEGAVLVTNQMEQRIQFDTMKFGSSKRYWEDFRVGEVVNLGTKKVEREEILQFALQYDPQPFHIDEEAAKKTLLKGLAASGWHSCAMFMRMVCEGLLVHTHYIGWYVIDEVKWLVPVRPDDVLTGRATCMAMAQINDKQGMGLCTFLYQAYNDSGSLVMSWHAQQLFERRSSKESPAGSTQTTLIPLETIRNPRAGSCSGEQMIKYFESVKAGDQIALGSVKFTEGNIEQFSRAYEPISCQTMDEDMARQNLPFVPCASGWHITSVWMKRIVRYYLKETQKLKKSGRSFPNLGPSSGVKKLCWHKPVHAGDVISFTSWAERKIECTSKPDWGLLISGNEGVNQNGELVISFFAPLFLERLSAVEKMPTEMREIG